MDKTSAVDLYTDIGPKYQHAFTIPNQLSSLSTLLTLLPPNSHVLDVGCGTGKPAAEILLAAGHSVTGIDITPTMIEIAQKQFPANANNFIVADSRTWQGDNKGKGYDCVISYYAFLTGVSPDDIRDFFPRAFGWLKKGGMLVFGSVVTPEDRANEEVVWLGRRMKKSNLSESGLLDAAKEAGFEVEDAERSTFTPEKAVDVGLCRKEDLKLENHLIFRCKKP